MNNTAHISYAAKASLQNIDIEDIEALTEFVKSLDIVSVNNASATSQGHSSGSGIANGCISTVYLFIPQEEG